MKKIVFDFLKKIRNYLVANLILCVKTCDESLRWNPSMETTRCSQFE